MIPDGGGASRSLLFALTGILWFASWVAGPSFLMTASMAKWLNVLLFSASLLSLAVALPVFGRMVGGPWVVRLATVAGAVAGLCSLVNIFEDGFEIDWFFFVFVAGLLILDVALPALTIVIARTAPARYRLLAVIPAGTVAGILLFPVAGGPIMLITWLVAAIAALKMPSPHAPVLAEPTAS
jgi:hypothetical protein